VPFKNALKGYLLRNCFYSVDSFLKHKEKWYFYLCMYSDKRM
jgi:hypothetical protein